MGTKAADHLVETNVKLDSESASGGIPVSSGDRRREDSEHRRASWAEHAVPGQPVAEWGTRPVVAVVDGRALSREGLVQLLEGVNKFVVVPYTSTEELLEQQADAGFGDGAVLYSVGSAALGDERSSRDLASLAEACPGTPVIVVSDREDSGQVGEALRLGVRGYIPTTLSGRILVEAVRLVLAGGTFVPAEALAEALTQRGTEQPGSRSTLSLVDLGGLTPRQREVLDLLRRGKPNKIIAHELSMRESTVKVHVRQIMRKLHVSNRTQAAFLAGRVPDRSED